MAPIFTELKQRFGAQIEHAHAPQPNELYLHTKPELAGALCSALYKKYQGRLAGVFAEDARASENVFFVYYLLALDAAHGFVMVRVPIPEDQPELNSVTDAIPAANWQEREIQDLFGIRLVGHPNPRRCALHDDWPEVYPLRKDFDLRTQLPPFEGERHKFREVEGEGVFQVPVGPVHAGIIEPGHFLFSVAGEPVLYLQLRMFYVHKGIEKLFESLPIPHCVRLAESISGDSSFAHATAFCHAVERAAGVEAPPRARALRTLCLELERLYNHIADIGAICTDVAFVTAHMHAMRLKERMLRVNEELTGNRLLRGMACLGGVRFDFDADQLGALGQLVDELEREFKDLVELIRGNSGTARPAGNHGRADAESRARSRRGGHCRAGPPASTTICAAIFRMTFTTRCNSPCRCSPKATCSAASTCAAKRCSNRSPSSGRCWTNCPPARLRSRSAKCRPTAWRWVTSKAGAAKFFTGFTPRPATGWRAARSKTRRCRTGRRLSEAILGNIIPDFPVVNKSFNLSYSGTDR